jgi:hypothetical protein
MVRRLAVLLPVLQRAVAVLDVLDVVVGRVAQILLLRFFKYFHQKIGVL